MSAESTTTTSSTSTTNANSIEFQGHQYLAPPFDGGDVYRNPTPNGFWSVVRFDANRGQLQVQTGRRGTGNSGLTIGYQFAAWQKTVTVNSPLQFYTAVVSPAAVVVRPNGGVVTHWAYMELRKGGQPPISTALRLYPGQHRGLAIGPNQGPGSYRLRVGVYSRIVYQGTATPYGEVIARVSSLFEHRRGPGHALGFDVEEGLDIDELARALEASEATGLVRSVGDEATAATSGLRAFEEENA